MQKRTRNILFGSLIVLFLIIAPLVILYARGYSLDTDEGTVIKTGIISIDLNVPRAEVFIDNVSQGIKNDPILLRGLHPDTHKVTLKAEGFKDWQAELPVIEEKVTRLEKLIMFSSEPLIEQPIKGPLGAHSVSSNNKYILFTVIDGKDEGLWLHTADKEPNRQLLSGKDLPVAEISGIRWSDNSKVALLEFQDGTYQLLAPHASNPTLVELPFIDDLPANKIYFDQDEPSKLFFTNKNLLYSYNTQGTAKPELISEEVIDLAVHNPKIFVVTKDKTGNKLGSVDLRVSDISIDPIINMPNGVETKELLVSSGLHIVLLTTNGDLLLLEKQSGNFTWAELEHDVDSAMWSPDARYLAIQKGSEISVFDQESLSDERELFLVTRLSKVPNKMMWHPDSQYLLTEEKTKDNVQYQFIYVSRVASYTQQIVLESLVGQPQINGRGESFYYRINTDNGRQAITIYTFSELEN